MPNGRTAQGKRDLKAVLVVLSWVTIGKTIMVVTVAKVHEGFLPKQARRIRSPVVSRTATSGDLRMYTAFTFRYTVTVNRSCWAKLWPA